LTQAIFDFLDTMPRFLLDRSDGVVGTVDSSGVLAVACAVVALGVEVAVEVEVVLVSGVGWVFSDLARRLLALDRVIIVRLSLSLSLARYLYFLWLLGE
jgi:hypothetical protein